jgi:HPt (histidine-containing phosphotransfer) domain-containing protein
MTDTLTLDFARALTAAGGKRQRLYRLLGLLESDLPAQLAEWKNAIVARDSDRARRCAHTIKSHAAHVGAQRLHQVAQDAELAADAAEWDRSAALGPVLAGSCAEVCAALDLARRRGPRLPSL